MELGGGLHGLGPSLWVPCMEGLAEAYSGVRPFPSVEFPRVLEKVSVRWGADTASPTPALPVGSTPGHAQSVVFSHSHPAHSVSAGIL